jgi:uncharacterized membrane protein YhdT
MIRGVIFCSVLNLWYDAACLLVCLLFSVFKLLVIADKNGELVTDNTTYTL